MSDDKIIIKAGDAADIIKAAREGQETRVIYIEHDGIRAPLLLRADGGGKMAAEGIKPLLDSWRTRPVRREGSATFGELDSFIQHTRRFMDDDSAVFVVGGDGVKDAPTFTAVLDYHERVNVPDPAPATDAPGGGLVCVPGAAPRFGKHRGTYKPATSKEWKEWTGKDAKVLDQASFADFIKTNAAHVYDVEEHHIDTLGALAAWFAKRFGRSLAPSVFFASCQRLLDVSEDLTISVTDKVGATSRQDNGETRITFESERTSNVDIPRALVIAIPVFEGGDLYQIPVRLTVAVKTEGDTKKTTWKLDLYGVESTFRAAVKDAREKVIAATGLPLFVGSPE